MAKVFIVGLDPETVDFSDPAAPPGLTLEIVRRSIEATLAGLADAGQEVRNLYVPHDPAGGARAVAADLRRAPADCVVVGGASRMLPRHLALFEAVLNAATRDAPAPAIALIGRPDEAAAAVDRALAVAAHGA